MPVAHVDDLTGFGFSAQQSELLGGVTIKITGVGTTQTGAAVVTSRGAELNPAGGASAFVFPTTVKLFQPYYLVNPQSTAALVFVPSGHTLNGTANASVSISQNATAIIWQYKPKNWTFK